MTMYYAKSTGGFYADAMHGETMPVDVVEISADTHQLLMDGQERGKRIIADDAGHPMLVDQERPTPEQSQRSLMAAVQQHLDAEARALGYDDIKTAVTYADEPAVLAFQMQGIALRAWRSKVWEACISQLAAMSAGVAAPPTAAQLIASLPSFAAPCVGPIA